MTRRPMAMPFLVLLLISSAACGGGSGDDRTVLSPTPTAGDDPTPTTSPEPASTPTAGPIVSARGWALGFERHAGSTPLSVVLRSDDGGATWSVIRKSTRPLHALEFTDREHGVVIADDGLVLRTRDAGATWTAVDLDAPEGTLAVAGVAFADADVGVVTGAAVAPPQLSVLAPVIVRTTDGGTTWSGAEIVGAANDPVARAGVRDVCFTGTGVGLTVGGVAPAPPEVGSSDLVVLVSHDRGGVWTDVTARLGLGVPTTAIINTLDWTIACAPNGELWMVGRQTPRLDETAPRLQMVSFDEGLTWSQRSFESEFPPTVDFSLSNLAFADAGVGWALTAPLSSLEPLRLFQTFDGGASWRQNQHPAIFSALPTASLAVADSERAVIVGEADRQGILELPSFQPFVWFTEDGGRTPWRSGQVPDSVLGLSKVDLVP